MESGEDDSHSYNDDSHSYIDDTSSVTDELQSLEDLDLGGLVSVMSLRFLAPDVERLYLRHIGADRGFSLVWAVLVFLLLSLAACMVFAAGLWSSEGANAPAFYVPAIVLAGAWTGAALLMLSAALCGAFIGCAPILTIAAGTGVLVLAMPVVVGLLKLVESAADDELTSGPAGVGVPGLAERHTASAQAVLLCLVCLPSAVLTLPLWTVGPPALASSIGFCVLLGMCFYDSDSGGSGVELASRIVSTILVCLLVLISHRRHELLYRMQFYRDVEEDVRNNVPANVTLSRQKRRGAGSSPFGRRSFSKADLRSGSNRNIKVSTDVEQALQQLRRLQTTTSGGRRGASNAAISKQLAQTVELLETSIMQGGGGGGGGITTFDMMQHEIRAAGVDDTVGEWLMSTLAMQSTSGQGRSAPGGLGLGVATDPLGRDEQVRAGAGAHAVLRRCNDLDRRSSCSSSVDGSLHASTDSMVSESPHRKKRASASEEGILAPIKRQGSTVGSFVQGATDVMAAPFKAANERLRRSSDIERPGRRNSDLELDAAAMAAASQQGEPSFAAAQSPASSRPSPGSSFKHSFGKDGRQSDNNSMPRSQPSPPDRARDNSSPPRMPRGESVDEEIGRVAVNGKPMAFAALRDWGADVVEINRATEGHALYFVGLAVLEHHNLVRSCRIDEHTLHSFLLHIERKYGKNEYHNSMHGCDVMLHTHLFLTRFNFHKRLSHTQLLAAFIGALIHDFNHPGTTNAHEKKVQSLLALTYSDQSILERHHLASSFMVLKTKGFDILSGLSSEEYFDVRGQIIEYVLETDLTKHFDFITKLKTLAQRRGNGVFTKETEKMIRDKMAERAAGRVRRPSKEAGGLDGSGRGRRASLDLMPSMDLSHAGAEKRRGSADLSNLAAGGAQPGRRASFRRGSSSGGEAGGGRRASFRRSSSSQGEDSPTRDARDAGRATRARCMSACEPGMLSSSGGFGEPGSLDGSDHGFVLPTWKSPFHDDDIDPRMVMACAVKFADLNHAAKSNVLHREWSMRITKEFWALGDKETTMGVPIGPLCDRIADKDIAKSQIGFFQFICIPFFEQVCASRAHTHAHFLPHSLLTHLTHLACLDCTGCRPRRPRDDPL